MGRVPERQEDSLINMQGKPCLFHDQRRLTGEYKPAKDSQERTQACRNARSQQGIRARTRTKLSQSGIYIVCVV